eukprot:jgi/Hompol1/886/HPOL_004020-RA
MYVHGPGLPDASMEMDLMGNGNISRIDSVADSDTASIADSMANQPAGSIARPFSSTRTSRTARTESIAGSSDDGSFLQTPPRSASGRRRTVADLAGSLFSQTASWLKLPPLTNNPPDQEEFDDSDSAVPDMAQDVEAPALGWFETEVSIKGTLTPEQLRHRESMNGLRWEGANDAVPPATPSPTLLATTSRNAKRMSFFQNSGDGAAAGAAGAGSDSGRSWLSSIRTAISTTTNNLSTSIGPLSPSVSSAPQLPRPSSALATDDSKSQVLPKLLPDIPKPLPDAPATERRIVPEEDSDYE